MVNAIRSFQITTLVLAMCLSLTAQAANKRSNDVNARTENKTLSVEQREQRLRHARELLGKYYSRSVARVGEDIPKINGMVYRWTRDRLPKKFRSRHQKVAQTIIDESLKYGFDPVFLMSVIEGESSWRPALIGGVGEIGLMQIKPATGKWIAEKFNIPFKGPSTLKDPVQNIKIGAAFLSFLRDHFDDHAQLYLAAYNMGQSNVASALERNIWPKDYPTHVMKHYVEFYETMEVRQKLRRSNILNVTENPKDAPVRQEPST